MPSKFRLPPMPSVKWDDNEWNVAMSQEVPRRSWDDFWRAFTPEPGEHLAVFGATGQGKTVLLQSLLPKYPFIVAFATKPSDISMERLITQDGYVRLARWTRLNPIDHPRRVIWPDATSLDSVEIQAEVFGRALDLIFREGGQPKNSPIGWAVAIDELWYISNMLNLNKRVKLFLLQARSLGHSLCVATQRPSQVPLEVYSQSTHLFFFQDSDRANLDRLAEINARASASLMRTTISNLEEHQVLYVNTRTGRMMRTRAPAPRKEMENNG